MYLITFPENLHTTSGLSILLHGVISLPDATSLINYILMLECVSELSSCLSSKNVLCA